MATNPTRAPRAFPTIAEWEHHISRMPRVITGSAAVCADPACPVCGIVSESDRAAATIASRAAARATIRRAYYGDRS